MKFLGNLSLLAGMFFRKFGVIRVVAEATCMKIWGAWIGCEGLKIPSAKDRSYPAMCVEGRKYFTARSQQKTFKKKSVCKRKELNYQKNQEVGYSYLIWLSKRKRTLLSPDPKRVCRTDSWEKLTWYIWKQEIPEGTVSARRAAAEMFLLNEITPFL